MGWPQLWSVEIRRVAASALVVIGVLLAVFAGVFKYVDQHFYTAETFVEDTESLRDNAEIRERIFAGFRSEIIRLADGDELDEESDLTDLAAAIAAAAADAADAADSDGTDPVTDERIERDQAIEAILIDILDSDLYDRVFTDALKVTQTQIVRSAELEDTDLLRDKGPITFDLRRLYPSIYERLAADEKTAFITETALPDDFGVFAVADRETTTNLVWSAIRNGPGWRTITYVGAVLSLIGAVVVADRRPSTAIQFGGGMAGSAAVVLVVIFIIRALVPLLAGGGSSGAPVVAVYANTIWPLVRTMIWIGVLGAILAFGGWVARLIWPDDWMYSHVSDDRGIRSIKRRRGAPEPEQQNVAAAVPAQYPGYGQAPYAPYSPGWAQPYPGQPYPPPGAYPYPVGPYAQPSIPPVPFTPGRPTVPVMPVGTDSPSAEAFTEAVVDDDAPAKPTISDLPDDAAQVVPRLPTSGDNGREPAADPSEDLTGADGWSIEPDW